MLELCEILALAPKEKWSDWISLIISSNVTSPRAGLYDVCICDTEIRVSVIG